jgi:hypothetical protein
MRTPVALSPSSNGKERAMALQRLFAQPAGTLEQRLADEAERLRKQAENTPAGIDRERLIRRARQAETAAHINHWMPLKPPS